MGQGETYSEIEEKIKRIKNVQQASGVLGWDQQVMMPEGGVEARAQQKSALTSLQHQLLTDEELGDLIQELDEEKLDRKQKANIREFKEEREKAVKVPEELLTDISEKESESVDEWRKARDEDDFERFAPHLREMIELKRRYAEHIDPDSEPYEVLFRDFEPFIRYEKMEEILEKLGDRLSDIIDRIKDSEESLETDALKGEFSQEKQEEINREMADALNFDFERGRLDSSTHPFTSGNQYDTRITTRYSSEDLAKSLLPTIHETGHALYQQGLKREDYGIPTGEARDLSVHESQSRFWENQIGRSREFVEFLLPMLEEKFPEEFEEPTEDELYQSLNQVYENNPIRVEADELTYHLHIVVRFEIGKELMNGELDVKDLPERWNDKMEEYLGFRPENDAEGCLQDIHWSWGNFGYFPTYSIGSVLATQIFDAMEEEIEDIDGKIRNGEFEPILEWLRENIHSKGKLYRTEKLIKEATGQKPSAEPFLEYVEEKYSELYGI